MGAQEHEGVIDGLRLRAHRLYLVELVGLGAQERFAEAPEALVVAGPPMLTRTVIGLTS